MAINPEEHKQARTTAIFGFESGCYDLVFAGVGENVCLEKGEEIKDAPSGWSSN